MNILIFAPRADLNRSSHFLSVFAPRNKSCCKNSFAGRFSQSAAGYQYAAMRFVFEGVTRECFYRGSSCEPACGELSRTTA
jgi:hypothetical protein